MLWKGVMSCSMTEQEDGWKEAQDKTTGKGVEE